MDEAPPARGLSLFALAPFPLIEPGTDLGEVICRLGRIPGGALLDGDVVAVAQKIVSKAENRYVDLADVKPSERASALAEKVQKDPRLVEVILSQSRRVLRHRPGVLIVEHKLGFVVANAGVDQSNVDPARGALPVLLLPENPDAAAARLREQIRQQLGRIVAVVINDSFGRAWRLGTVGVALGAAGLPALMNLRGTPDLYGRRLQVSETALADEIAAAASLLMGQASEASPVVVLRGLRWPDMALPATALVRDPRDDLFR